jgi:proteasome lid subunit RPN8/RPN11
MIIWQGRGANPVVQCSSRVVAEISELAMSGYRRYPWGGVEIGGLLFGRIESGTVYICTSRTAECEHHYGPAFELSEKDCESFARLMDAARSDEQLSDLTPVGWYQSTSRRDIYLSDHARNFFQRFFPDPGHVALVVQRSKGDPLSAAVFMRDSEGSIELHSPVQEFKSNASPEAKASAAASV